MLGSYITHVLRNISNILLWKWSQGFAVYMIVSNLFLAPVAYRYSKELNPKTMFSGEFSFPVNQELTKFPLNSLQSSGTGMDGAGWGNTAMENSQNDTQNDSTFNKVVFLAYGPPPPPPPRRRRLLAHFLLGFTAGSAAFFGGAAAANAIRG